MDWESFCIVRGKIAPYYPNPPGAGNPDFSVRGTATAISPSSAVGEGHTFPQREETPSLQLRLRDSPFGYAGPSRSGSHFGYVAVFVIRNA